ncbi:MAG: hypothetical protein EOP40_16900 [Rubrivivax sp.]|nr:MAG: hypothetical protein EOP40_16900 [Rubrivivax sp.]
MIHHLSSRRPATLLWGTCILLMSAASPGWAGIYKCEMDGRKAEYRATPCPTGKSVALKVAASPVARPAAKASAASQAEAPTGTASRLDSRLSVNLPNTRVSVVLQVVADFLGYTLVVDPSIKDEGSFSYQNQPASAVLADLARRHGLAMTTAGRTITVARK